MPYNYRFHKPDGTIADLNDVDREMCEETGWPYSERNYCPMFVELTQWMGLAILTKIDNAGSRVTPENFDAYKALHDALPDDYRNGMDDTEWTVARKYLAERYSLELWYTR